MYFFINDSILLTCYTRDQVNLNMYFYKTVHYDIDASV